MNYVIHNAADRSQPLCQTYVVDCCTNLTFKRREPQTTDECSNDRTLCRQNCRLSTSKSVDKTAKTIIISFHRRPSCTHPLRLRRRLVGCSIVRTPPRRYSCSAVSNKCSEVYGFHHFCFLSSLNSSSRAADWLHFMSPDPEPLREFSRSFDECRSSVERRQAAVDSTSSQTTKL